MEHHRGFQLPSPPPPLPPSSSDGSLPILAISILGILITSILLLFYYVFAVRCRLNWRHSDVVARVSRPRRRFGGYWQPYPTVAAQNCGLDEAEIRAIPMFRYRYGGIGMRASSSSGHECAVCLNEFQEQERIRLLTNCFHVFHIDCIDTWLQTNANCPLCRARITPAATTVPIDQLMASVPHRIDQVAIDVRDDDGGEQQSEAVAAAIAVKGKKVHRHGSFGDECIDARSKGRRQLSVQPMRRSFSVGSSSDRQLFMAVQKILQQNQHFLPPPAAGEGSNSASGGRIRRAFFSFHRHSRSAVLPVEIEQ